MAVAALDAAHDAHVACRAAALRHRPALSGHAVFETYAVLTRLPGALRIEPDVVDDLMHRAFPERVWLTGRQQDALIRRLAKLGISGGMVYDAMVAEAARVNDCTLLTRDARARRTYDLVGAIHQFVE